MSAARRLAEGRDVVGIASKSRNVGLHPAQPFEDVSISIPAVAALELEKAVHVDAICERNQNDSVSGKVRAVKARVILRAAD